MAGQVHDGDNVGRVSLEVEESAVVTFCRRRADVFS